MFLILPSSAVFSYSGGHAMQNDLSDKKICIDPGHGGSDSGAIGPSGYTEKEANLDIAMKLRKYVENHGATAIMTRTTDIYVSLSDRCKIANDNKTDIFVSIHHNAFSDPTVGGTETYYHSSLPPNSNAAKLAGKIQTNLVNVLGLNDRGVKTANFYVLRNTNMPAALAEVLFISNPNEEALIKNESVREKVAWAIYAGICQYFGVEPRPMKDETPPTTPMVEGPFSYDEYDWLNYKNISINWSESEDESGIKEYLYSFSDIFIEGEAWHSATSDVYISNDSSFKYFSEKYALLGENVGGRVSYIFEVSKSVSWKIYLRFWGGISVSCDGKFLGNSTSSKWKFANFSVNLHNGKHILSVAGTKGMSMLDYISIFKDFEKTNSTSIIKTLTDGKFAFIIHAVDYADNIGDAAPSDIMGIPLVLKIDSTPPSPPDIICKKLSNEQPIEIRWRVILDTSPIKKVDMIIVGDDISINRTFNASINNTLVELYDGNYTIKMRVMNAANLFSEYSMHSVCIDTIPPQKVKINPLLRYINTTDVFLSWSSSNDAEVYHVFVNDERNEYLSTERNECVIECKHGRTYIFGVSPEDLVGNVGEISWTEPVTIDTTPPENLTVTLKMDYEYCDVDGNFTAIFSADEYESGIMNYIVYAINESGKNLLGACDEYFYFNLQPGKYEFEVISINNARLKTSKMFCVTVNIPPHPIVDVNVVGKKVIMESRSYDPDGKIVKHFWDMDNDGIWDIISDVGNASYEYNTEGMYDIVYGVVDELGVFSSYSFKISVKFSKIPVNFTVNFSAYDYDGNIVASIVPDIYVEFVEWSADNNTWYRAIKNDTYYIASLPANATDLYIRAYNNTYTDILHFKVDIDKKLKKYECDGKKKEEIVHHSDIYSSYLVALAFAIFIITVLWLFKGRKLRGL